MSLTFFSTKHSSKEIFDEKVKPILINDSSCISLELVEIVKSEITDVISKYLDINKSSIEIKVTNNEMENANSCMIVANIPIKSYLNKR